MPGADGQLVTKRRFRLHRPVVVGIVLLTAAVLLGLAWVACVLVPGAQPMPVFLPVPLAMVLTTGVFVVVLYLNGWVLLRPEAEQEGVGLQASGFGKA